MTIPLAAAVALLYLLMPYGPSGNPRDRARTTTNAGVVRPFDIAFCPVELEVKSDRIGMARADTFKVVAIFQTWKKECECHGWQLYEWEDDRSLADMTPEQIHDIALAVTGAPALEELQVVAIARDAADMPLCVPESCELVECLNQVTTVESDRDNSTAYATAVRECLPDSVQVFAQAYPRD